MKTANNIGGAPAWIFNSGEYEVDAFVGCALDYATNTLYCTTEVPSGGFANNVWALSTLDGSLKWATNVSPVASAQPC